MSTLVSPYEVVLDPAAYAGIDLLEEDGKGIQPDWHRNGIHLLIDLTVHLNRDRPDFFVGTYNFIYSHDHDNPRPDYFFMKDGVDRFKKRLEYTVCDENGRCPDVIIELMSPASENEDRTTKFATYERTLETPEYFLYAESGRTFEGYRLHGGRYEAIQADSRGWLWSEELGVWLGPWTGQFLLATDTYLRFYTASGDLVLLRGEAARQNVDNEEARAGREKARADEIERELVRLRAMLAVKDNGPKKNGAGAP